MHELSVTQNILDIAEGKAKEANASSVRQINLVIGDMSSVVDDSVQFYFDLLSKGTIAEGAQLHFKRIPVTLRCRNCSHEYIVEKENWQCSKCQAMDPEIMAGKEFYLDSIEVEG